ncbi:hypothetical protein EGC76_11010 [Pseudidiomarina gelatinasegens]|uniref:Uncharacterized protein n=1 Tax=Pseudidiomarina gelatinasegens TaxID=2487740 RepID=A0A443YXW2_9GAMM|nr:hypothetical protein [Pseudidiomarina gelatinasegens]RWU08868.1 hypothetical protein EGC76_11010 [Pseudidiomarina gelatinasegens]
MSFKRLVLEIATSIPTNEFTVEDVRKLCEPDFPTMKQSKLHSKVYKTMWALKKDGFLDCIASDLSPKSNIWSLTSSASTMHHKTDLVADSLKKIQEQGIQDLIDALKGKLSDFSAQLAILSSEIQQYHDLSKEFPKLSPKLKPIFQNAKQQAVIYQGRIQAIENTLNEIEQ